MNVVAASGEYLRQVEHVGLDSPGFVERIRTDHADAHA